MRPELVPIYIGRLKNEPIMQGKSFSALQMQVPQIVQASKGDGTVPPPVTADFIEFNLQSTGLVKQQSGEPAATGTALSNLQPGGLVSRLTGEAGAASK
jgi:hypothetical protein